MPIRQFLLLRQGKDIGYAYRARSVEAIRLYRKLEQELVTKYGFKDNVQDVHNLQPGTVQNVNIKGICEGILKAIWGAIQMACSTTGKNDDLDNAFARLSDLLRGYSNKDFDFALSIEGLEQAKRRDEQTSKLFEHFAAKYDRIKPIKFEKKKRHEFWICSGEEKTIIPMVVDHPPQVHALEWRLKKRWTRGIPLRHPHFYPHPFIGSLTVDVIGRPLGLFGGPTHGLKPLTGQWTPQIEVYIDGVTALYFKLNSGGFSSAFRSTIKLEEPDRVVFRDVFGQLLTQTAIHDVVTEVGNTKEMKYSVWSPGMLQADAFRTLEEIAETPFLYTKLFPAPTAEASLPHNQGKGPQLEPPSLDLLPVGPSLSTSFESALQVSDPTAPPSVVANAGEPLPDPNRIGDVQVQLTATRGPSREGEASIGSPEGRTSLSSPRILPEGHLSIRGPRISTVLERDSDTWIQVSSPEEFPHQPPQSNRRPTLPRMAPGVHDSGVHLTQQDEETGMATIFRRSLAPKGSGPKGKGIAAGIAITGQNAVSLFPNTAETFPEAKFEKEKPQSWVHKHIVKPIKKVVRRTVL